MKTWITAIAGTAAALAVLALGYVAGSSRIAAPEGNPAPAAVAQADTAGEWTQSQIENVVRDYLVANPELLIDMQTALETKQREEQQVAQAEAIRQASAEIFHAKDDAVLGNPDGNVTIVEFFDYNCGFCRHALEDMQELVASDPQLRFVLKEFPVLGPDSTQAHIVAEAFKSLEPEKYAEFHQRLLGSPGRADESSAIKVALALGADETALREAMKEPRIGREFNATYALADRLAITGTPSYVVGNEVISGALGRDVLREKIEAARDCQSGTC